MDRDAEVGREIHQQLEELINQRATPLPEKVVILVSPSCPGGRLVNLVDMRRKLETLLGHGEVLWAADGELDDYIPVRSSASVTIDLEPEAGERLNRQLQLYALGMLEAERRYSVVPPTMKPKQQQPFWTKDWRHNGRKH